MITPFMHRPARVISVTGEPGQEVYLIQYPGPAGKDLDGVPLYHTAQNAPNYIPPGHFLLGRPAPGGGLENQVLQPMLIYAPGDIVAVLEFPSLANPEAVPDDNTMRLVRHLIGLYVNWVNAPGQFVDPS